MRTTNYLFLILTFSLFSCAGAKRMVSKDKIYSCTGYTLSSGLLTNTFMLHF